jgi:hypothetical protein
VIGSNRISRKRHKTFWGKDGIPNEYLWDEGGKSKR